MAEQNEKTRMEKLRRLKARELVDLYLDYVFADTDRDSIAREGRSILGTYSEHGELPQTSGFAGFCKLAGKIDRMRVRQVTESMVRAFDLVRQVSDDNLTALCVDRCYRGRTKAEAIDPFHARKPIYIIWDDRRCADYLGISKEALRKRISRGYQELEEVVWPELKAA